MLALFVVLALAVWGLLRLRVVPAARPDHTQGQEAPCAPPHAAPRALRQPISRDAVRRSQSHALRAPGPLCERAPVFHARYTRRAASDVCPARRVTSLRAFKPIASRARRALRAPLSGGSRILRA